MAFTFDIERPRDLIHFKVAIRHFLYCDLKPRVLEQILCHDADKPVIIVTVGVLLMEEDSRKVDAGNPEDIASLANAVQGGFQRFRTFTANDLGRFVL